jgi:hypothetical protein
MSQLIRRGYVEAPAGCQMHYRMAGDRAPRGQFAPMHGASLDVADQESLAFVDIVDGFLRKCGAAAIRTFLGSCG